MSQIKLMKNYIGDGWVDARTELINDIPNPATGEIIARVPLSGKEMSI